MTNVLPASGWGPSSVDAALGEVDAQAPEVVEHASVGLVVEELAHRRARWWGRCRASRPASPRRRPARRSSDPKRVASRRATRSPTMRMPSAFSRRARPRRLRAVDRAGQVLRRLLGQALQLGELGHGQPVEVGEVLHEATVDELLDHRLAEVLDVHRAPGAEMPQPLLELGRAGGVHAAPVRLALRPERHAAARRAALGEGVGHGLGRPLGRPRPGRRRGSRRRRARSAPCRRRARPCGGARPRCAGSRC